MRLHCRLEEIFFNSGVDLILQAHKHSYVCNNPYHTNKEMLQKWEEIKNCGNMHFRLEEIFFNSGVDLILQAHEHSYERLWPMYKGVVLSTNYTNPRAPVQLVTGSAGSKHGVDPMLPTNGIVSSVCECVNMMFNPPEHLNVTSKNQDLSWLLQFFYMYCDMH